VIDFVFANVNIQDRVLELRVEKRVDSDHIPGVETRRREGKKRKKKERKHCSNGVERNIICWDTKARKEYWRKTEEKGWKEGQKAEHEDGISNKLKCLIKEAILVRKVKIKRKILGHKDWWEKLHKKEKKGQEDI